MIENELLWDEGLSSPVSRIYATSSLAQSKMDAGIDSCILQVKEMGFDPS
jgi:hypothetical protein